jgi:WD40 repeat protein
MLWDFAQNKPSLALPVQGNESWGTPAAFSLDGKNLVACLSGRSHLRIFLWDVGTGKKVRQIGDTWNWPRWAEAVGFSPDGKHLLVSTRNMQVPSDTRLECFPAAGGEPVWSVPTTPYTHTAIFSGYSDLALLAHGEMSNQWNSSSRMHLTLWDTARGKLLRELKSPE